MNDCVEEHFDDVRLMIARARKHKEEFDHIFSKQQPPKWWSIQESLKPDGQYACTLVIQCQELKALKPAAADICNNLIHALDVMVGALARVANHGNSRDLYFPWQLDDDKFERKLKKLAEIIGVHAADSIRIARETCKPSLPEAHVAKEISNTGKHWELVPSNASVPAIALNRPGCPQQIFTLPADTLEEQLYYTFYEGSEPITQHPMYVLVGLKFRGVGVGPVTAESVFGSAFHFVETVFEQIGNCEAVVHAVEEHLCNVA